MKPDSSKLNQIQEWLSKNPGLFLARSEAALLVLKEGFSGKERKLREADIQALEQQQNTLKKSESYLVLLLSNGHQLILAPQGFVFPPDFTNTGPIPLPNSVYCMQDYQNLFHQLSHIAAEADRSHEAAELIMVLIAILDGAKTAGLDVDTETLAVEQILNKLEKSRSTAT